MINLIKKIYAFIFLFFISSCLNNFSSNKSKQLNHHQEIENDVVGIWKIDSISTGNIVTGRPRSDDENYSAFRFEKNGMLYMEKKEKYLTGTPIGDYKVIGDSVFFLNSHGITFQRYMYIRKEENLILQGNFIVSELINEKPTFYLSRKK